MPIAHEKWFVESIPPEEWSFASQGRTMLYLAAAVAITLGVRVLARRSPGVDVPFLARLVPWMPFAVRIHLAVSLVGLLSGGTYLAPSMDLGSNVAGWLLGIGMAVTAFLLVTGWHARAGALLLVLLGPIGMLEFGFRDILERVDMLGAALFVLVAGPGRWSADRELGARREPSPLELGRAVWLLRVAVGVALIVVAFAEKLANPQLAQDFLASQSLNLNVPDALGLPVSDLEFIRIAGAIEVLFGLLLISGALPQAVVVIAGVPFNTTLYLFGTIELLGHLPVYGAMLVLLVYGSDPTLRPWCSRLWPWTRAAARSVPAPA